MKSGDQLPPLEIPITRTLVVAGAIASRDYQDVHHDAELARQKGSPDIFMNILTTNGLVGRYITDHFGPRAALRQVAIRLGGPNYPGDTMVLTGTIEAVTAGADGDTATVHVVGANALGRHVTGTVTVTVPTGEPEALRVLCERGEIGDPQEFVEAGDSRELVEPGDSRESRNLGDPGDLGGPVALGGPREPGDPAEPGEPGEPR
jgi:hypothetical protein